MTGHSQHKNTRQGPLSPQAARSPIAANLRSLPTPLRTVPEVADLEPACLINEHVGRLEVPVHHPRFVEVREPLEELQH